MPRLAIIGAGKMGSAFYKGLADEPELGANELLVCDPSAEKLAALEAQHTTADANEAMAAAPMVLIAVKPQSFPALMESVTTPLTGKLVLSIMAGVPLASVIKRTGSETAVRSMPNLGAQIGQSLTAWIASEACSEQDRETARWIFGSVGQVIEVQDESLFDPFTAIANPAYYFQLAHLLAEKAKADGFAAEDAQKMGKEVLIAAGKLLEQSSDDPAQWAQSVASKGGVTEAALQYLAGHGWAETLSAAADAGTQQAKQLDQ